jgi:aminocarboxymuconate-semialdehyde decarboxylase
VPLQAPELAAAELPSLMASGFAGVEIAASVNGVPLGDDRLAPFWTAAEASGALVFIHPTTRGSTGPGFDDHYLWNLVGNPMETTVAAAHLVLSGVLERHPDLRILLAHGGGAVLALRGRLQHGWANLAAAGTRLGEAPAESLRRLYYDTVVFDPNVLRELVAFAGADRVLLGSDYPFDMADARPADTVAAAGLDPAAEEAILGGNAARLLGLEVHR